MIIPSKHCGYGEGGKLTSTRRVYDSGGGASQTQVSDLPDWAKPYAKETLGKGAALTDIEKNPYQQYGGERIAGFNPMQQQSFMGAAGMQPSQLGAQAGQFAGAATLGALGTSYDPYRMGQFTSGRAAQYMNPFLEQAMEPQLREAARASEMMRNQQQAQAVGQGAFGGSRQAIVEAERQRNLGQQQGDIRARGYQTAFDQAQQNFAREQQLREQSRQFGANVGLQGLQTALQGAGQMGQLGGQQFAQEMDINKLQNLYGGQQQALEQQGLSQQYQDFMNQQRYPYQQLEFMSNLLRGTPMGTVNTLYGGQGSTLGQLAGLGIGAYGALNKAEGGSVSSYADGGVTSDASVDGILDKLSDQQLQQAKQIALAQQNMPRVEMIDKELAERASMKQGLGSAFNMLPEDTQEGMITAAGGGIVALSNGGDFESVGPEFGGYSGEDRAPKTRSADEVGRIVDALRERGRTVGLSDIKDITAGKGNYTSLLEPVPAAPVKPAAPTAAPYDRATATRREDYQKKPGKASDGGISTALAQIAKQTGESERSIQDIFDRYKKTFESENATDMKSLTDLIEKSTGRSKKVKEESLGRALAEFGFKWAASASKPGARFLGSAAEAAPTLTSSLAESAKLAREMDENDMKLRMNLKQFEIAQRTGNRKEALAAAAQERMLMQNQAQLKLRERELAQQAGYQQSSLKQRGEQFERLMGVREQTAAAATEQARTARERVESAARQKFESEIAPRLRRELAQQYGKDWEQTSPAAQAVFAQRRNTYMRGEVGAASGVTPLSSLFSTEDMKMIGYGE